MVRLCLFLRAVTGHLLDKAKAWWLFVLLFQVDVERKLVRTSLNKSSFLLSSLCKNYLTGSVEFFRMVEFWSLIGGFGSGGSYL